jgi:arylsulfatase A-like enzyme
MRTSHTRICRMLLGLGLLPAGAMAQDVLPFPEPPMGGEVGPTMQQSVHKWREQPSRLPDDAPNILIVMFDDAGFGQPSTFGGEINTPTLSRLAEEGISYNRFHTTAMCSPTRASLMTGRNHHRVGAGIIAEFANDWDGYTGVIPKSSATIAEVLGYYGYATAAFGKDHNTPIEQTANGPYDRTPTGRGFDYFYGFIAGETSQWEPTLWENTTPISMPHVENYEDFHLTEAMADKAITWMRRHLAMNPDRPFLMWWTPGAVHGPHHVAQEWADKYEGKFDDGWDAYQERVFERQKAMGWIPADTQRPPRPEGMPAWRDIPQDERAFQARLMEVYAGFLEHTDAQVGKLIDELEARGIRDNTIVIYILSDNGASAEGLDGSVAELNAQNGIPEHDRRAHRGGRAARRARGDRRSQDGQHVPLWLGLGRRQPLPLHEARRGRLGRHAHADGGLLAEAHRAGRHAAFTVHPRERRRADDLRDPRHPAAEGRRRLRAGSHRRRELRLHLRLADATEQKTTQYFESWAAAASTTRAGWPAPSARRTPWVADCRTWPVGTRWRTSGSFSTRAMTTR